MTAIDKFNGHEAHQTSGLNESWDELVRRCWPRQECWDCLRHNPCSWCPSSGTCVPNKAKIPLLSPIFNSEACSHGSERWEIRTTPLGCHVSTITLLTCIISVLSTFVVIGIVAAGVKAAHWFMRCWKARPDGWWKVWKYYHPGWWRGWRLELIDNTRNRASETVPLLA